jgi:large subunit ribosomal protein L5
MARLQERYTKEIAGRLAEKFGRTNRLSLPRLEKIVVNMGVGKALQDKNRMKEAADHLAQITASARRSPRRGSRSAASGSAWATRSAAE